MANVAVRLNSDYPIEERRGPAVWPADVREIGDAETYSEGGHSWQIMSMPAYTTYCDTYLADYEAWLAQQQPDYGPILHAAITRARNYGMRLVNEFAAGNVLRGITCAEVRVLVEKMMVLNTLVNAGSLATAKEELDRIELDNYFTAEVRDHFKQDIQDFLDGKVS